MDISDLVNAIGVATTFKIQLRQIGFFLKMFGTLDAQEIKDCIAAGPAPVIIVIGEYDYLYYRT